MHARLSERLTPYGDAWSAPPPSTLTAAQDLVLLNKSVTEQAAMIAYNNDFKLMMVLALCAIPLAACQSDRVTGAASLPSAVDRTRDRGLREPGDRCAARRDIAPARRRALGRDAVAFRR